jgi:type IV pilus assembly protein PilE
MKVQARGFSLIELMIALAVIGILMAIAMPNYNDYVTKGKMAEAMSVLSDLQVREEAYYTDNRAYTALSPRTGQIQYFETTSCVTTTVGGLPNQGYTCTATSTSLGYTYRITEAGTKTTVKPDATTVSCWLKTPGGSC